MAVVLDHVELGPVRVVGRQAEPATASKAKTWAEVQRRAKAPPSVLSAARRQRDARVRASYDAGSINRLNAQWGISTLNANRDLRGNLVNLRARSRDLERNDPYAKKFLDLVEANVVGAAGISVQSRAGDQVGDKFVQDKAANAIIEREYAAWSRAGNYDVTGKLSRSAFERLLVRTVARDGEVLVKHVGDPSSPWGMRLQMLEADWLDERLNLDLPNGHRVVMGVELDPSGRAVAYHLHKSHPGDDRRQAGHVRYSADELKHYFIAERPEQVRGVPWMHAAMMRLYQLGEYDESAILAARLGADKSMMLQDKDGQLAEGLTDAAYDKDGNRVAADDARAGALYFNSQKGSIDILPAGAELVNWDPNYPSDVYGPFVLAALRGVASALGVSYESLSNDRNGVTWTSIRHAVLDDRDHWKALQGWLIDGYAWDTCSAWLRYALLSPSRPLNYLPAGKLAKFLAFQFHGRRWDWVNPKDDIEAKAEALRLRLTSHRRVLAEQGMDLEEVLAEIQDDKAMAASYGIDLNQALVKSGQGPAPAQPNTGDNHDQVV